MRRRSRVRPKKGSQENCRVTRCLPKRVRQSLNTQPSPSGKQDVGVKRGLTFAVKPSPDYKLEKNATSISALGSSLCGSAPSIGDRCQRRATAADQRCEVPTKFCKDSYTKRHCLVPIVTRVGHPFRDITIAPLCTTSSPSTMCLMMGKESSDATRTRKRAWITEGAVLAPKVLLVSGVLQFYHRHQFGPRRIRLRGQRQPSGQPQTHAHPRAS